MHHRINVYILTLAGLTIVVLALTLRGSDDNFVQTVRDHLEWTAYDLRMRALLPPVVEQDRRIVIVDIDERSLREEGHWPWPRWKLAKLVRQLADAQAAVIGFDVVFAESEANPAEALSRFLNDNLVQQDKQLLESLDELAPSVHPDQVFATAVSTAPVILGYVFTGDADKPVGMLPAPLDLPDAPGIPFYERESFVANLHELQDTALGGGFFSVQPDSDGVIRRAPLLARYQGELYPSLSLEVARAYLGLPPVELEIMQETLEAVSLEGMISIPTDGAGRVLVPYRGQSGSFPYVPATDILNGTVDPEVIRDAIVLIGTSAVGLVDMRATPVQSVYPGVEVHANIIAGILDETFVSQPPWVEGVDFVVLLVLGILLSIIFPRLTAGWLLVITLSVAGIYLFTYLYVWQQWGINISITVPVSTIFTLSAINMTYGFLQERRDLEILKDQFGQYVPPQVVEKISAQLGSGLSFEGETREITVLFADIRNFTELSEHLAANDLKRMLNYYFTEMTGIIFEHGGTIDKYIGDLVMAFWGAPLFDPQHRVHALETSMAMLKRLESMQSELRERDWPEFKIGIGINTGPMNVGDMGSRFRRSYTVIGDSVNLGSRLEGLTKYYGVSCIASEFTISDIEGILFRKLDVVRVKGKDTAVTIFEPVGKTAELDSGLIEQVEQHENALAAYFERDWEKAGRLFSDLNRRYPEQQLYALYLDRLDQFRSNEPPAEWDGVFTHKAK